MRPIFKMLLKAVGAFTEAAQDPKMFDPEYDPLADFLKTPDPADASLERSSAASAKIDESKRKEKVRKIIQLLDQGEWKSSDNGWRQTHALGFSFSGECPQTMEFKGKELELFTDEEGTEAFRTWRRRTERDKEKARNARVAKQLDDLSTVL